jgi:ankyrin repeat protein
MRFVKTALLSIGAAALFLGCQEKADPNKPQSTEMTMALVKGDLGKVKELLDAGESVEAMQEDRTPLCIAALNGHVDIIDLLISRGAQVNYKDKNGQTPLMYAASNGKLDAVKELLAQKADIEATTNLGETALMGAVGHGYLDEAKLLVEKGANIHAKTNNGRNVYILAWERYNGAMPTATDTALFKWLKEKADPGTSKQMDSAVKAANAMERSVEMKTGGISKKK